MANQLGVAMQTEEKVNYSMLSYFEICTTMLM